MPRSDATRPRRIGVSGHRSRSGVAGCPSVPAPMTGRCGPSRGGQAPTAANPPRPAPTVGRLPELVHLWLTRHGWRDAAEGLQCPDHP
ncbi:hypothetical protein D5S18_25755 [Nocardia panacis]|uniref:Uncharacterized protein n=1 Tax=Nocardia panacis TaxID=2340916 RepID=A0A3A4JNT3_9NOCA|nr:hypothetical protein D5S18_25755 [Nocardia panacis]